MNFGEIALWGFLATLVLTAMMTASQGFGISRINLPFMLGSIFTPNRDRAKVYGFLFHLVNGWIFALLYVLIFRSLGASGGGLGAFIGGAHALIVLIVFFPMLPAMHPRMANEQHGPSVTRRLEPPGFLGLHYGYQTPLSIFIAHIAYGWLLGTFVDVT